MKRSIAVLMIIFMALFAFSACEKDDTPDKYGTHHAEMTFENYGTIKLELYGDIAPITVKNFVELAKSGYYNGTVISRIQPGFVIQGGQGSGTSTIKGEFTANGVENNLSHTYGVISMARATAYDSASDQFFISISDSCSYSCDYLYASFGKVTEGMDIIEKMVKDLPSDAFINSNCFLSTDAQIKITSVNIID